MARFVLLLTLAVVCAAAIVAPTAGVRSPVGGWKPTDAEDKYMLAAARKLVDTYNEASNSVERSMLVEVVEGACLHIARDFA